MSSNPQQDADRISTVREFRTRVRGLEQVSRQQDHNHSELYGFDNSFFTGCPLPYQSLDSNGMILEVNPSWLAELGYQHQDVAGRWFGDFLVEKDRSHFKEQFECFKKQGQVANVQFEMLTKQGDTIIAEFSCVGCYDKSGQFLFSRCVFKDVTESVFVRRSLELTNEILMASQQCEDLHVICQKALAGIQALFECECVGIRLLDQQGNIPYEVYQGFPEEFCDKETPLTVHVDHCMCIEVIKGAVDVSKPFITEGGSFYINGTSEFLATVPEAEKGQIRNTCNQYGYESVALIPIRDNDHILGLIHIADSRLNRVAKAKVLRVETLARQLGVALKRLYIERQLVVKEATEHALLDAILESAFLMTRSGKVLVINRVGAERFGTRPEEVVGRCIYDMLPADLTQSRVEKVEEAFRTGQRVRFEDTRDGRIYEHSLCPILSDQGQMDCLAVFAKDVTEKKRQEKVNQSRLQLLRSVHQYSLNELLQKFLDEAEKITESQIGFYHFLEEDQETLTLQTWSTNTLRHMCTINESGRHYPLSEAGVWVDSVRERMPVIHNDYASLTHKKGFPPGHAPVIRELVVPVIRADKIVAVLGVGNKTTGYHQEDLETVQLFADLAWETVVRKRAEELMLQNKDKINSIFRAAPIGIGLIIDSVIAELNDYFCEMTGYTREELQNQHQSLLYAKPEEYDHLESQRMKHVQADGTATFETQWRCKDGHMIDVLLSSTLLDLNDMSKGVTFTAIDISQRKLHEYELLQAAQEWQTTFDASHDVIWQLDRDHRILRSNKAGLNAFSGVQNVIGKQCWEVVHGTDRPIDFCPIHFIKETLQRCTNEIQIHDKWLEVTIDPILDKNGCYMGAVHIVSDITKRKHAELKLLSSEQQYRALINHSPDVIMRFDLNGRHQFVSERVEDYVDLKADELIGKTLGAFKFTGEDPGQWEKAIQQVGRTAQPVEMECEMACKQGRRLFNWRLIPEIDFKGNCCSILSIARDITHHRHIEQRYQSLFNKMLDGFASHEMIYDTNGYPIDYRFLTVNPAFEKLTGLQKESVVGKTVLEVMPDTEDQWIQAYAEVVTTGEAVRFESYAQSLGKYFEVVAFPIQPGQFACIFVDATDRKEAENHLLDYQTKLKALATELTLTEEREKQYLAESLHDNVQQDLAFSRMTLQMLEELTCEEAVQEGIGKVVDSLSSVIESVRSLTFNLNQQVLKDLGFKKAIANWLREQIYKKHNVQVILNAGEDLPALNWEKEAILFRSIRELLANAIKHGHPNSIVVGLQVTEGQYQVTVEDDGQGFDVNLVEEKAGTKGFGLFSIRERLDQLGGAVDIESRCNLGTRVVLSLPLDINEQ